MEVSVWSDPALGCRWWFWLIAAVVSAAQGVRGFLLYRDFVLQTNAARLTTTPRGRVLTTLEGFLAYQLPDFLFNFVCSIAGFVALAVICRILPSVEDFSRIELGTGVFFLTLFFVAITGMAGVLPYLLSRGHFPKA